MSLKWRDYDRIRYEMLRSLVGSEMCIRDRFKMTVLSSIFKNTQTLCFKMIFAVLDV